MRGQSTNRQVWDGILKLSRFAKSYLTIGILILLIADWWGLVSQLFAQLSVAEVARLRMAAVVYIRALGQDGKQVSIGSGFIVNPQGLIVTNFHVIRGAYGANVELINGQSFKDIWVKGFDITNDIAIISVQAQELHYIPLGNSDRVKVGEKVVAIGNPEGLRNTVSDGVVSGLRTLEDSKRIQFTAPVSTGSSGGVLLDLTGHAIGIVTESLVTAQNINFAIPINTVRKVLGQRLQVDLTSFTEKYTAVTKEVTGELAQKSLKEGKEYLSKGSLIDAEERFREAVRYNPSLTEAWVSLGNVYLIFALMVPHKERPDLRRNFLDQAILQLEKAVKLDPKNARSHSLLAEVFLHQGNLALAVRAYLIAKSLNPRDWGTYIGLGRAYAEQGKYQEAVEEIEIAISLNPDDYLGYAHLGYALFMMKKYGEASEAYAKAISLKGDEVILWRELASTASKWLFSATSSQERDARLAKAIGAWENYIRVAQQKGELEESIKLAQEELDRLREMVANKPLEVEDIVLTTETYVNRKYGFEISRPGPTWAVKKGSDPSRLTYIDDPEVLVAIENGGKVAILTVWAYKTDLTLKGVVERQLRNLTALPWSEFEKIYERAIDLSGQPAIEVLFGAKYKGITLRSLRIILKRGDTLYDIAAYSLAELFGIGVVSDFRRAISSFRLFPEAKFESR